MTPLQLLSQLGAKGIKLWIDEKDQLRFKAPKGVMTTDIKEQIIAAKSALIIILQDAKNHEGFSLRALNRGENIEFPLSFAQQRFWFLDRLEPGNPSLHIPAAVRIQGTFNPTLFSKAFNAVIQRHESLRTYFVTNDKQEVLQKILPHTHKPLKEDFDFSHLDEEKAQKRVQQILTNEALKPFHLAPQKEEGLPFFRAHLIRLSEQNAPVAHFVFMINLHHIIADGWSMQLLINEICYFYQTFSDGKAPSLPDLHIQYVDYAYHQKQWLQGASHDKQLQFWLAQLRDTPALRLPIDSARPDQPSYRGDSVDITISAKLRTQLENIHTSTQTTLFTLLLGAYQILLMRHSAQKDFAIGTPVTGRRNSQLEPVVGCFINLLALRHPIDDSFAFDAFLPQLQTTLTQAQDNQDIPFESIAEHFSEHRSLSTHPIFQVLFTLQKDLLPVNAMGENIHITTVPFRSVTAKYDLQCHIHEGTEHLMATFEFNSDIFRRDHIKALAQHYLNLLVSVAEKPHQAIKDINLYDTQDFTQFLPLLKAANQANKLLIEQLEKTSLKRPEHIAVSQGAKSISHGELHQKANALAQQLLNQGARANQRIAICLPPGINCVVAMLAVMKTGAAYVPMDTSYPPERLQLILAQAQPLLVITHQPFSSLPEKFKTLFIDQFIFEENVIIPETKAAFDAPFYTIFTSGSTGQPKGVSVTQANIYNLIHWYKNHYQFTAQDRFLVISALGFDLTQKNLIVPLLLGAEIVFPETTTFDPQHIADTIYQKNISILNCVPSAFYPIIDQCERSDQLYALASLKHMLFGGETIKLTALKPWIDSPHFSAGIGNMYGPTECTDIAAIFNVAPVSNYYDNAIPIGQPIDGVSLYILDKNTKLSPIGTVGELYIGGQGVSLGYLNQPDATDAVFIDNSYISKPGAKIYKTGDAAKYQRSAAGQLEIVFVARLDDQIKMRGFRIEPDDIASRIQQHQGIKEALVAVNEKAENDQLVAYYTKQTDSAIDLLQLRHYLKAYLPDYMIPQAFIAITSWPLSANGKIDKNALPEPEHEHFIHHRYTAPTSLVEQQLCQLFADKLSIKDIGIEDNFFELGGHSILATQLVGAIQEAFGVDISIRIFFENPTVKALGVVIQAGNTLDNLDVIYPIQRVSRQSLLPLSPAQERLWIIEQMAPENSAYLIPFAIKLKGDIDKAALQGALHAVIERHETLRTSISTDDNGNAFQKLIDAQAINIETINLEPATSIEDALPLMQATVFQPFTQADTSLFRAALFVASDNSYCLAACLHHMIADGWSLSILQRDLLTAYDAIRSKQAILFTPLRIQYADYSVWQRQYLVSDKVQGHIQYWLQRLEGAPPLLHLPLDRERPAQQTFNGQLTTQRIDKALTQKLSQFCRQQGISHYHALLSVYFLLLSQYAKQQDICVGTPVAGRHKNELQNLIGYFVNTVIIRNDLSGNPDFYTLCQKTMDQVLGAFAHQDIPIEKVINQLPLARNLSYSPIAQVGFNLIDKALFNLPDIEGLSCEILDLPITRAKYDLTLTCIEKGEHVDVSAEFNTDLFDRSTIDSFLQHFVRLLDTCLTQPEKRLSSFDIIDKQTLLNTLSIDHQKGLLLPLNAMQKDMVLAQQLHPTARANTLGYRIEPAFPIDERQWQQAIQQVSDDQPTCRTIFLVNPLNLGEWAYQYLLETITCALTVLDYSNETLTQSDIEKRVNDFIYQPDRYTDNQFFHYGLMKIADNRHILLMSCHHAILDGISVSLLAQQHIAYYQALVKGTTKPVANVFDTKNYTQANRSQVDSNETLAFWQSQLQHCEPLRFSSASLDQVNKTTTQHHVDSLHFTDQEWHAIRTFCRQKKTTPALYFKVLYSLLIAEYCQAEDDFYITEFHAKRNKTQENALGCLFQQTPFITSKTLLNADCSLDDWLIAARQRQKQSKPFNDISKSAVQELQPQGALQFMYNYYHFLPETFDFFDQKAPCAEMPPYVEGAVQFIVKALNSGTRLELYYQPSHFNALHFLQRLKLLNQQVINNNPCLADLKLLHHHEYMDQQYHWQTPTTHQGKYDQVSSLATLLIEQAEKTPEAVALSTPERELTYAALNVQTNQIAHYLKYKGVGSDIRVGVCLNRDIEAILAIIAIIKAGGAYVPIDPQHPASRIQSMLSTAEIEICFAGTGFINDQYSQLTCIDLTDKTMQQRLKKEHTHAPSINQTSDDLLYVIFTSGSTGEPKGAALTHAGEINLQQWYTDSVNANAESRFLIISSLGFDLTQKNIFAPLITGGRLVLSIEQHYDSQHIASLIQEQAITHLNCAPSVFYPLVEDNANLSTLRSLKQVAFGGESIALPRLAHWLVSDNYQTKLTNHYGPTECTDIALYYPITNPHTAKVLPVGRCNPNINVSILNAHQRLVPTGLIGEIAIGGEGVGRGYLNNDALNKQRFIPNPYADGQLYLTGDLGRWNTDGQIEFIGRRDFQLKLNGQRIDPAEIEYQVNQIGHITDARVLLHEQKLIAYVLSEQQNTSVSAWKKALEKHLPSYMIPSQFFVLKQWPLNNNGKIDRKALPLPTDQRVVPFTTPRDDTEKTIASIIANVLNVSEISIHDNFFEIGANSLSASRAMVQIRQHFKVDIPLNLLFDLTTTEKLANFIKASKKVTEINTPSKNRVTGSI